MSDRTHQKGEKGTSRRATYSSWNGMIYRCSNLSCKRYKYYGGRGIKVCDRWFVFENFLQDMGFRPKGMSIDRIDNNGNYEPNNCRWATHKQQANNREFCIKIEFDGMSLTAAEWAEKFGLRPHLVRWRHHKGWNVVDIFSVPRKINYLVKAKRKAA